MNNLSCIFIDQTRDQAPQLRSISELEGYETPFRQIQMYKLLFRLQLFLTIAFLNTAHADAIQGALESYRNGQVADAISLLEPLAQQGQTAAESALGAIYYNEGGPNADRKAYELFLRAARKNDVEAQYNLANMYLYIEELPKPVENQDEEADEL